MKVFSVVYEIRQSAKGWSEAYEYYLNKSAAEDRLRELIEWKRINSSHLNFRLIEHPAMDYIVCSD